LRFQYLITCFELVCTSNLKTKFYWPKYCQIWSNITNYYANTCIFLLSIINSNLLDHLLHWALTRGPDHSSNGRMSRHLAHCYSESVTPGFKAKPNAHSMCVQKSSLHTYHTENGYRITNITIYSIYYRIMSLQKTKSNTLGSIAGERHHNSTGNRPGAIARLEHHIKVL
jgi:hypothetical protein